MKTIAKLSFTFALFVICYSSNAQNIKIYDSHHHTSLEEITSGDTLTLQRTTNPGFWTELSYYIYAKNTKSSTMIMMAKKRDISFTLTNPVVESHRFCFAGQCYGDYDFISPLSAHVSPNAIDTSFSSYYGFETDSPLRSDAFVSYTFYDSVNTADSAIVYVHYKTALANGVDEYVKNTITCEAYPNPANDIVSFNYELNNNNKATFVMYNAIGESIRQENLTSPKGNITIDTKELPSGIYYYSINGDKAIETNKLVITH
jgi:hypothetical protein